VADPIESWDVRVKPREYQRKIALSACKQNTLVVLPTGLGKTIIAMLVADFRLRQPASQGGMNKNDLPTSALFDSGVKSHSEGSSSRRGRVLVMAPTRPLTVQHRASFRDAFAPLPENSFALLTGDDPPEEREKIWRGNDDNGSEEAVDGNASSSSSHTTSSTTSTFIFATPETVLNDLRARKASLRNFVLLVFDEAHRCVKDYAYTEIARLYVEQAADQLILGLTASPGSTPETVEEVMKNLHAVTIEARSEEDEDVVTYVEDTSMRTVLVKLPEDFKPLVNELRTLYNEKISKLRRFGLFKGERFVSKKKLLEARQIISIRLRGGGVEPFSSSRGYLFAAMTVQSQAVIIVHAIELIETQGVTTLSKYLDKLRYGAEQGKSAKALLKDERWVAIEEKASKLVKKVKEKGMRYDHPKVIALLSLITEQFARKPISKVIIFTQYRDTIDAIISIISSPKEEGMILVKPRKFVGQSTKSETDKGMNQKLQKEVLEKFRSGDEFNVLVSSSIGEEGLHVPDVDLVIFYEAVPSAIRSIQRKGRTGRTMPGSVAILISEGTVDESYYHATTFKEKMMKKLIADSSKEEKTREKEPVLDLDELANKSRASPTLTDFMS
jgi:ERCC4-related helicase